MIRCEFSGSRSPLLRCWHLLRCTECRNAKSADAILQRGLGRLRTEPAPSEGLAGTLAVLGVMRPARTRRLPWQRALRHPYLPAGAVTALAAMGTAGWLIYIDMDAKIAIPAPAMPSTNAFDYLLKAADAIPDADRNLSGASVPAGHNRIDVALTNTAENQRSGIVPAARFSTQAEKDAHHVYTLEEKDRLLREYLPSLTLLRQGFAFPYQAPPIRSFNTALPYLSSARYFARVLSLEAQAKAEHHDIMGAAGSSLDAMELGAQISHGSSVIGSQTGVSCDTIGHVSLWNLVRRMNAVQARSALRRLNRIDRVSAPFTETLQEEKWMTLATIEELFHTRNWRIQFSMMWTGTPDPSVPAHETPATVAARYMTILPYSKRRILIDFTQFMDHSIAEAHKPYTAQQMRRDLSISEPLQDPVLALLAPASLSGRFRTVANLQTQHALLAASLALQAYRQERHTYPKTLQELVPEYLPAVPTDPFTEGLPLHYRQASAVGDQNGYQLYSIGPDGKDDSGKPITVTGASLAGRYRITQDGKGDIVAGTNVN